MAANRLLDTFGVELITYDGVSTIFNIAHNLNILPDYINVIHYNTTDQTVLDFKITYNTTTITITYSNAPISQISNVGWRAIKKL